MCAFRRACLQTGSGEIRALTREPDPRVLIPKLESLCAQCGVAVVFVPELPKTGVSSATRWVTKDKALIQLSLRYKTDDQLWFTFFHEAAHILKHGKKELFLEGKGMDGEQEREANEFAGNWLIPPRKFREFLKRPRLGRTDILAFADELSTAPGIVLGRLQHHNGFRGK